MATQRPARLSGDSGRYGHHGKPYGHAAGLHVTRCWTYTWRAELELFGYLPSPRVGRDTLGRALLDGEPLFDLEGKPVGQWHKDPISAIRQSWRTLESTSLALLLLFSKSFLNRPGACLFGRPLENLLGASQILADYEYRNAFTSCFSMAVF